MNKAAYLGGFGKSFTCGWIEGIATLILHAMKLIFVGGEWYKYMMGFVDRR